MARISVRFSSEEAAAAEARRQAVARGKTVFLVRRQDEEEGDSWHWEVHDLAPESDEAVAVSPQ